MWNPQETPDERQQPALEHSIERLLDLVRTEEEVPGIGRSNVFIGGSGQGFAVAAGALLADGRGDFTGLIGLNGWVPYTQQLVNDLSDETDGGEWVNRARALLCPEKHLRLQQLRLQQQPLDLGAQGMPQPQHGESCGIIRRHNSGDPITPIFMAHPHYDEVIHCSETSQASDVFQAMGWDGNWYDYPDDDGSNQRKHGINQPEGVDNLCEWIGGKIRNCGGHPRDGHLYGFYRDQVFVGARIPDDFEAYMRAWLGTILQ